MIQRLALVLFVTALAAGTAAAQPAQTQPSPGAGARPAPAEPPAAAAAAAAAEVKAATGVDKREPVGEASSFAAGTTVWAWSRITGAAGTSVKHVWKKDGKDVWAATLKVGSRRWTTYSRRKLSKPGAYEVAVVGADGAVLGTVSFTVQ